MGEGDDNHYRGENSCGTFGDRPHEGELRKQLHANDYCCGDSYGEQDDCAETRRYFADVVEWIGSEERGNGLVQEPERQRNDERHYSQRKQARPYEVQQS